LLFQGLPKFTFRIRQGWKVRFYKRGKRKKGKGENSISGLAKEENGGIHIRYTFKYSTSGKKRGGESGSKFCSWREERAGLH
jgi:hypothetical protein